MREKLLSQFKFGVFPPPNAYVNGLPMTQFEGILCNIDRRLQLELYALVTWGTYNQRYIGSLHSETMFSNFQDIEPKGSGVLRPDDIPAALGAAACIYRHKLSDNRTFDMKTSRKRVYLEQTLTQHVGIEKSVSDLGGKLNTILASNHTFDKPLKRHHKLKR